MFRAAFSTWKYSHFPKPAELIALIPNTEGQQSMMSVAEVRAKSKAHWGLMGGYPDVKTEGVQP
ncbi:hypothetical protein KKH50_04495 [Patescibacteria group bacterium]|nr:hypothetical protein [Patescibacteria group bacterium]